MGCTASTAIQEEQTNRNNGKLLSTDPERFSESQKKLIKRSWKILSNDMSGNGTKIFLRIFYVNPMLKSLFPFGEKNDEDLVNDSVFKGHASRFMQAVGAAVDNIGDLNVNLGPLLLGLGREHIRYKGFKPGYWTIFAEAMMTTWSKELGDKFTVDAQVTWKAVFDYIMNKLKEGYALAVKEQTAQKNLTALAAH